MLDKFDSVCEMYDKTALCNRPPGINLIRRVNSVLVRGQKRTRGIKIFGGLKNRGGKAFRGPVTEGCDKLVCGKTLLEYKNG